MGARNALIALLLVGAAVGCSGPPPAPPAPEAALTGRVTDQLSSAPITGAAVQIVELDTTLRTDTAGAYVIRHLRPDTYHVQVEAPTYFGQRAEPVVLEADTVTRHDAALRTRSLFVRPKRILGDYVSASACGPAREDYHQRIRRYLAGDRQGIELAVADARLTGRRLEVLLRITNYLPTVVTLPMRGDGTDPYQVVVRTEEGRFVQTRTIRGDEQTVERRARPLDRNRAAELRPGQTYLAAPFELCLDEQPEDSLIVQARYAFDVDAPVAAPERGPRFYGEEAEDWLEEQQQALRDPYCRFLRVGLESERQHVAPDLSGASSCAAGE